MFVMKKVKLLFLLLLGVIAVGSLNSCSDSEDSATGTSKVSFYLTDAPSLQGYKAVKIDVQQIKYTINDSVEVNLPITPRVYNLMDLTNGTDTLLSNIVLNEGEHVSQVRLVLGDNNSVVLSDGTEVNIKAPSAQTSGLKVNIQESVVTTSGYAVMIDFDAERSIVRKGNGNYSLKPVIRGYVVENTASISGHILPDSIPFKVFTIVGTDTITTVSDTARNNFFMLHGLKSGTYTVEFQSATLNKTISVDLLGGFDKDLGNVEIK